MPTWDYKCDGCGDETTWTGAFADRPETIACYVCVIGVMRRCWRTANFIINGFKAANGYSKDPT